MGLRGPIPASLDEIFLKIEADSFIDDKGCYVWKGNKAGIGYGTICQNGKSTYIHRLVYEAIYNEIPKVIRHTCDNPACWNPDHLLNGTHADNVQDKVIKGRHIFGTKQHMAKLTPEYVREIRSSQLNPVELGKKFGVSKASIYQVLKGKTWKHVK